VRQPIEAIGRAMVRLLLEEMEEGAVAWRHVILRTELVVRESTGPARGDISGKCSPCRHAVP
jgi:DNA-binding LacI/PurR family transcriptional regulator